MNRQRKLPKKLEKNGSFFQELKQREIAELLIIKLSCKISNRKSKRTFNERVGGEKR